MAQRAADPADAIARLEQRLARERAARAAAERAAEDGLRRLYEEQARLELRRRVTVACTLVDEWEEAAAPIAEALVHETAWVAAHVVLFGPSGDGVASAWASDDGAVHAPMATRTPAWTTTSDGTAGVGATATHRRSLVFAGEVTADAHAGGPLACTDARLPTAPLVAAVGIPVVVDGTVHAVLELFAVRPLTLDAAATAALEDLVLPIARLVDRLRSQSLLEALVRERTQELEAARARAEAAVRSRDVFLARLAHGLRTPLHGATALLELLRSRAEDALGAQDRIDLALVERTTTAVTRAIDDLVDLSRLDAGTMPPDVAAFALRPLVNDVCRMHELAASRVGTGLSLRYAPAVPSWVDGDARRVRQLLDHVLEHAVARTHRGVIDIGIDAADGRLRVVVRDDGPPIPPSAAATYFSAWVVRADGETATTATTPTTAATLGDPLAGIAVATAHELARHLGGTLSLEAGDGTGATFVLDLPLPASAEVAPTGGWGSGPRLDRKTPARDATPSPRTSAVPAVTALAPRALLVQPDAAARRVSEHALATLGFRVDAFAGPPAVSPTRGGYDLVVVDVAGPYDAPACIATLRGDDVRRVDDPTRRVTIVALTADPRPAAHAPLRAAGTDAVVVLPIGAAELATRLAEADATFPTPDATDRDGAPVRA